MATPRKTAVPARRAEVNPETEVEVTFEGNVYTISRDISLDVFDALSTIDDDGNDKAPDLKRAVQVWLGVDQWKLWRTRHSKSSELSAFFTAAKDAVGAGN
jgi:hypothetical protein